MARIALGLSLVALASALVMFVPMPGYGLWLVRLLLRETSLLLVALSIASAGLAGVGQRAAPRTSLAALVASLAAGGTAAQPLIAAAPAYEDAGVAFSLSEYAFGVDVPEIAPRGVELAPGLAADVYRAAGEGARPLVVVVHGGSWQRGGRGEAVHLSRAMAAAGLVVADVEYRLAPRHRLPAAVGDVKCAVGRLRARAQELGVDPDRVALLGRSAGGEVALVAAYSMGDPRLPAACDTGAAAVAGVVSLYAPTDLAWGHANPPVPDPIGGPASIEAYLGGPPAAEPEAYRLASPTSWTDRALPPTLIIHGTGDQLVPAEHARRLARAIGSSAQRAQLLLVPLAEHGFDRRPGGIGEQLARARLLEFLRELRPAGSSQQP
jgi:acetyl esterase/lipase